MTRWFYSGAMALLVALVLAISIGGAHPAMAGDDPDFITFHIGSYDVNDDRTAGQFNLEYRSDRDEWYVKPFAGVMATTDAAAYVYGGFLLDVYLGRRIVFTPNVAVGLYSNGDGKDLGNTVEFRAGLELAYRLDNRARLGMAFHHISNASLSDNNPGTETLTLSFSLPLDNRFVD